MNDPLDKGRCALRVPNRGISKVGFCYCTKSLLRMFDKIYFKKKLAKKFK